MVIVWASSDKNQTEGQDSLTLQLMVGSGGLTLLVRMAPPLRPSHVWSHRLAPVARPFGSSAAPGKEHLRAPSAPATRPPDGGALAWQWRNLDHDIGECPEMAIPEQVATILNTIEPTNAPI